jgi:hypothetical protein
MQFVAYGHQLIEGTHKTTFEITQHTSVTPKGDCIIGTRAAFDPEALAALAQVSKKLEITLKTKSYSETITGEANNHFVPGPEIVIRKNAIVSPHTLVVKADKAAADLPRHFIEALKNPEEQVTVIIERI